MNREGIQTRRGYEQGGDTDRMRGGRRSWNRGWGGGGRRRPRELEGGGRSLRAVV
jgi:hypothetical protein